MIWAKSFTEAEELPNGLGDLSKFSAVLTRSHLVDRLALHRSRYFVLENLDAGLMVHLGDGIAIIPWHGMYVWRDRLWK